VERIGEFLERSGRINALSEAGVVTSGTADSFWKASHLTKTRHAHHIPVFALNMLPKEAFELMEERDGIGEDFDMWKGDMIKEIPTFQYWNLIMEFELHVLMFIRAHRTRNFELYVKTLEALAPWFFALDWTKYSRWIPVHICDLQSLPGNIKEEFAQFWVLSKTANKFSCVPLDQVHEQNNERVKGMGGTVGLTENPVTFIRWMVAGPEQARVLEEIESHSMESEPSGIHQQHEQCLSCHTKIQKQVNLCNTIRDMRNPFLDKCPELLVLDTRNCVGEAVISTVRTTEHVRAKQYQWFVKDVLMDRNVSI
jgi:hypothetical protein